LVHSGSLSNHNSWRRKLRRDRIPIETENDTEVAAAYITWKMQQVATLGAALQAQTHDTNQTVWDILNPKGSDAIAVGLDAPFEVNVRGSTGYYCAGMNKQATVHVHVHGSVGHGTAENMMSGTAIVQSDASQYAGATGNGGTLIIKGNTSSRCGISMKGIDIIVHSSIGHMSAFMAQSRNLVVCGDTGDALGESIYEARLFVRSHVKSLGADCIE
jgi:glutamate synthase domain-containing protein 3